MNAAGAEKIGKLQQMLLEAPEYFSIADKEREACKKFLALAATASPVADEIDTAYVAAVREASSLVTRGVLTGVELSELDGLPTSPRTKAAEDTGVPSEPSTKVEASTDVETTDPIIRDAHGGGSIGTAAIGANESESSAPKTETKADETTVDVESPAGSPDPSSRADLPEREVHPVAAIFPMMPEADLKGLADDIKANGLRDDIITVGGKIADGRNRYAACKLAGVEPRLKEWDGEGSLVAWVMSVNLQRRHLTDQQRAIVAARAKEAFEAEARERRLSNLAQNGGSTDGRNSAHRSQGRSAEQAAAMLEVSVDSAKKASKVLKAGAPELVAAVEQGKVSLDAAEKVSKLPRREQRRLVGSGNVKAAAAKLRKLKAARKAAAQAMTGGSKPGEKSTALHVTPEPAAEVEDLSPARPEPRADEPRPIENTAAPPITPEPVEQKPAAPSVTEETSTPAKKEDALSRGIAALPDAQRSDLKGLLMKTGSLAFKIPSATEDDASLVLRGLGALVVRAHGFLSGEDDGAFLRDALETEDETNGGVQ